MSSTIVTTISIRRGAIATRLRVNGRDTVSAATSTSTNSRRKRAYKKIGSRNISTLRLMGGFSTGEVGYSELFSLGGAYSLRGFEDDQFKVLSYAATLEFRADRESGRCPLHGCR